MKMANCKCKGYVETVESTATTSKSMMTMMKKKRKLDAEGSEKKKQQYEQLDEFNPRVKYSVSAGGDLTWFRSGCCDRVDESRCCRTVSDCSRSVDFEVNSFETEDSTSSSNKFSRETTPVSEICENTTELMNTPAKKSKAVSSQKPTNSPAVTMPSTAEIDEFFSKAEKHAHDRFAEKYNYDVVKDLPMDGRYEWIKLKP